MTRMESIQLRPDAVRLRFYATPDDTRIYITMYGMGYWKDEIIDVPKSCLDYFESKDSFAYVWGMPGPDYNRYFFKDYGNTWAFSREDFGKRWNA